MRCERCNGTGIASSPHDPTAGIWSNYPCPDCGGCGFSHCCEGGRPALEGGDEEVSESNLNTGNDK
jgi:hypothetical protein